MAKRSHKKVVFFKNRIPPQLENDIDAVVEESAKDNKEKATAFCKIKGKDRLFTGSYSRGEWGSVEVKPCERRFGNSTKVGDLHTHVVSEDVVGLTPSDNDVLINLEGSADTGVRQVSCIANNESKMIHCFQAREIPSSQKLRDYHKALERVFRTGYQTDPFLSNNVYKDFAHAWYDRKTKIKIPRPTAKNLVRAAIGKSTKNLRYHIADLDKGEFCDIIQDYNAPDRNDVGIACRKELKRRKILGIEL